MDYGLLLRQGNCVLIKLAGYSFLVFKGSDVTVIIIGSPGIIAKTKGNTRISTVTRYLDIVREVTRSAIIVIRTANHAGTRDLFPVLIKNKVCTDRVNRTGTLPLSCNRGITRLSRAATHKENEG